MFLVCILRNLNGHLNSVFCNHALRACSVCADLNTSLALLFAVMLKAVLRFRRACVG